MHLIVITENVQAAHFFLAKNVYVVHLIVILENRQAAHLFLTAETVKAVHFLV